MEIDEARVQARVFIIGGLPVCGAIVSGFVVLGASSLLGGPPLERLDWIGGAVFVGFAALGLAVSLRASLRVWRQGRSDADDAPLLARVSPLLVVVGLVAGVFIGRAIQRSAEGSLEQSVGFFWCEEPALLGFADAAQCETEGLRCLHETWRGDVEGEGAADELERSLTARRATLVSARDFDAQALGAVDRLLTELKLNESSPRRSAARRAGLGCLAARARR